MRYDLWYQHCRFCPEVWGVASDHKSSLPAFIVKDRLRYEIRAHEREYHAEEAARAERAYAKVVYLFSS